MRDEIKKIEFNKSTSLIGLRGRLFAGFGTLLIIILVATSFVLLKIHQSRQLALQVVQVDLPSYDSYLDLNNNLQLTQISLAYWLLTHNDEYKVQHQAAWKNVERIEATLTGLSSKWSDEEVSKWTTVRGLINQLKLLETKIMVDPSANILIDTQLKPLVNNVLTMLDGPLDANYVRDGGIFTTFYNLLHSGADRIILNSYLFQIIECVLLIILTLASIIISFYTARSIVQYINIYRDQSRRIASGDLTQRVSVKSSDEMGLLGEDLNVMTDGLSTITRQITEACHNMVTMISQVKHAVDSQSIGATEQSSSINQITASLEEIEKSSTQTIEKAKSLGQIAERTREKGELGLEAVEQSVNGMKVVREKVQNISQTIFDLSNQTHQVGEITAVVNMLAQQSKMLSLNASIEAAKAGEAGKGFAVVAAEVKNLAEQSEQATAQIQKIIEDIRHATEKAVIAMEEGTKGVDIGTDLVEQTGDIVRSLSEVIHETSIASQQIEAAIRQEGIGIEQITAGMNEINQVTSSSVEGVRQTTEAIDNLGTIANTLKKYTDVYKV